MYPYELNKHAFNPVGAPNTWPYVVGFIDWLADLIGIYGTSNDVIEEESIDDERRHTSMDIEVYSKSAKQYETLSNAPLLNRKGKFLSNINKLRAKKAYEDAKGEGRSKDIEALDPKTKLKENITKCKDQIKSYESKEHK